MHRRRVMVPLVAALALLGTLVVGGSVPATADDLSTKGQFLQAFSENGDFDAAPPSNVAESIKHPTAVSLAALPNGKFVYWNGLENLESDRYPLATDANRISPGSRSRQLLLDGGTASFQVPTPEDAGEDPGSPNDQGDLFCADQRIMLDGSVAAIGGTVWKPGPVDLVELSGGEVTEPQGTTELHGNNATRIFESSGTGGTWTPADRMTYGRWYPAVATLPDGKLFVAGGVPQLIYNMSGLTVHETETFDPYVGGVYAPKQGSWSENGESGETSLPLFARLHVIHDGSVLYDGVGQMWGPFGQAADEALWHVMKSYNPATKTWTDKGIGSYGALSGAVSVMLPFKPDGAGNYNQTKILHAGGVLGTSPGLFLATNLSETVTIGADGAMSAEPGPQLNNRRWYSTSIIGATGDPFIFSGADKDEVIAPGSEAPVRQAEMYDIASGTFIPLATAARDRTYHNSGILMADGRMLIGGHAPINAGYGPGESDGYTSNDFHNASGGMTANNLKDSSFEIYEPPYLHRGVRPAITSNVSGIMEWGTERTITTPDAATVQKAILVKMPATTHVTDPDARAIEVPITSRQAGSIKIAVPSNRGVAIPGYYYLFLTRTNAGFDRPTVSNGIVVRVGDETVFGGASADIAPVKLPATISAAPAAPAVSKGATPALGSAVVEPVAASASTGRAPRSGGREGTLAVGIAALVAATGALLRRRRVTG